MWDAWRDLALGVACVICSAGGRALCADCAEVLPAAPTLAEPDPQPEGLAPVYVAGPYADPLRNLLIAHKERRVLSLARPLGRLLAGAAEAAGAGGDCADRGQLALVAVPSRRSVVRQRGHDPVLRMVRAAAADLRGRGTEASAPELLRLRRRVEDQVGLDARGRAANVADALGVDPRIHRALGGRTVTVVLCDDIVTTGATAREAQRALAAVGIEVAGIAAVATPYRRDRMRPG